VKYVRLGPGSPHTFVLVFQPGDAAVDEIISFARSEDVRAARLTAIGGFSKAVLAYFDRSTLRYEEIPIDEQVEVLSLLGDIALKDGQPLLHAHAVVGRRDGSTSGGHLIAGTVWPTLEVFVDVYPTEIVKKQRTELGIATIDLGS
jgi:uncharacterized protein